MHHRRRAKRHGVEDEPHLGAARIDGRGSGRLEDEPAHVGPARPDSEGPSVADEPGLTWRDLDPAEHQAYRHRLQEKLAGTPWWWKLGVVLAAAIAAGPFAVFGAFYKTLLGDGGFGIFAIVVVGPALEEVLKVACILWIVERRPWWVPGAWAILFVGATAGLVFAAIENVLYLRVYFPDHEPALATWRWTINVALHTGCSLMAAVGVAKIWKDVMQRGREAEISRGFPWLVAAIVTHGTYNLLAVIGAYYGLTPQ